MTREEWEDWFSRFRAPLGTYSIERLDESERLKSAIAAGKYQEAEEIAHHIVAGTDKSQNITNRVADRFTSS